MLVLRHVANPIDNKLSWVYVLLLYAIDIYRHNDP